MHNYIYVSYSFRGHEKDLFHLNKIIPYVLYIYVYIYNCYYSKRFQNYSGTLLYRDLIAYFTVLTFLYISCYSHVWNKLKLVYYGRIINYSPVTYFTMFPFYYVQCLTGIRQRFFLFHLRKIVLLHYTFYCKHLPLVSGIIFIS